MIKPTVGRVVYFRPHYSLACGHFHFRRDVPLAAMITAVWSDICVNLVAFDQNGNSHGFTSIPFEQQERVVAEGQVTGSYAHWMPYQIGQAAKTEALQAQLDATFPSRAGAENGDASVILGGRAA